MISRGVASILALSLLAGAADARLNTAGVKNPTSIDWKLVVTKGDLGRIRNWRHAFMTALGQAKTSENLSSIALEGALLEPDSGMDSALPPAGAYRCRVIKMGANGADMAPYTVYPSYDCMIRNEGGVMSFYKTGGQQRPVGLIFSGDDRRRIFLGTMMLGDEKRAINYGRDARRDMAGTFERIGQNRWRMILPYPHFESLLDVIDIAPIAQG